MKKNETFAQFVSTLLPGATTSRNMSTLMSSECALKNHFTIKLSRPKKPKHNLFSFMQIQPFHREWGMRSQGQKAKIEITLCQK